MAHTARRHVSLFLAFDSRHIEVLTGHGFDGICRQVETVLGLHPKSFDIVDACGEVDSDHTLQRILGSASGFCVLEVREKPEWQRMREMDAQIKLLMEKQTPSDNAINDLVAQAVKESEQKILSHVEDALTEMRESIAEVKAQLNNTISPVVHDIACEQIDVRSKLSGILPLMQDMALEQIKMRSMERNSNVDVLSSKVEAIEVEMSEQAITATAVTGHLECGLSAARQELETLRMFTADQLKNMDSRVETMEAEMTEQAITASSVTGHLECGLSAAKKELETLRNFTADQLKSMDSRFETMEVEMNEQAITTSSVTGHLECGLSAAQKELQLLRSVTSDQLSSMNKKVDAVEADVTEHAITTSAVTGHVECGLSTAKKELETLRHFTTDQLSSINAKVESMDAELSEQAITASAVTGHLECGLSAAQAELKSLRSFTVDQLGTMPELGSVKTNVDLRTEVKAARLNSQEALAGLEAVKKEVRRLTTTSSPGSVGAEDRNLVWSDGFSTHTLSAIPYSKKNLHRALNEAEKSPFAHHAASRQVDRLMGSRSVPQLPTVA